RHVRARRIENALPHLCRAGDRNATAVVAAKSAIRDSAAASDTATRQDSIVADNSTVSEYYGARDPAAVAPWLPIMFAISCVAADGAAGDRHAAGDAAASEVALVTADGAVGDRQRA